MTNFHHAHLDVSGGWVKIANSSPYPRQCGQRPCRHHARTSSYEPFCGASRPAGGGPDPVFKRRLPTYVCTYDAYRARKVIFENPLRADRTERCRRVITGG